MESSTAGATIGIVAGNPATYDVAGYGALNFVTIGEITDLGEFGREYNVIRHNPVGTRGTKKLKGSYDEGSIPLQLALDEADDGQLVAQDASESDDAYSFCVTSQGGNKYYFQALVTSFKRRFGGVDDITSATINLEITTNDAGIGVVIDLAS